MSKEIAEKFTRELIRIKTGLIPSKLGMEECRLVMIAYKQFKDGLMSKEKYDVNILMISNFILLSNGDIKERVRVNPVNKLLTDICLN